MPLPRALGRFNRRVTNRILGPLVVRLPGFGYLVHRGRQSGQLHRTPVLAMRRGDRVVFALTYGPTTDWARNAVAAGRATLDTRRGAIDLTGPVLIHDPSRRTAPAMVRPGLWLLGCSHFLAMRMAPPAETDHERNRNVPPLARR